MLAGQNTQHVHVTWWSHHSAVLTQLRNGCRGLTWVRVIRADRAEQVLLPLIVELAQQLAFLQHKLVTLPQLPVAHAAAEAVQVVHTLQGTHHKLRGRDLLHAAAALGRKQPAERRPKQRLIHFCQEPEEVNRDGSGDQEISTWQNQKSESFPLYRHWNSLNKADFCLKSEEGSTNSMYLC